MSISMSLSARYTVQSSAYDRLLIGRPLTDRLITKRKAQGYFGGQKTIERQEKSKSSKKKLLKALLLDFKP